MKLSDKKLKEMANDIAALGNDATDDQLKGYWLIKEYLYRKKRMRNPFYLMPPKEMLQDSAMELICLGREIKPFRLINPFENKTEA